MYTPTKIQSPRGHTTRPRIYTIGNKVNSLLCEPPLSTCETWILPHAWILHMLRYNRDDHVESKDQGQAWKRRRKRIWPLQNERHYRPLQAVLPLRPSLEGPEQPPNHRPGGTTGQLPPNNRPTFCDRAEQGRCCTGFNGFCQKTRTTALMTGPTASPSAYTCRSSPRASSGTTAPA